CSSCCSRSCSFRPWRSRYGSSPPPCPPTSSTWRLARLDRDHGTTQPPFREAGTVRLGNPHARCPVVRQDRGLRRDGGRGDLRPVHRRHPHGVLHALAPADAPHGCVLHSPETPCPSRARD